MPSLEMSVKMMYFAPSFHCLGELEKVYAAALLPTVGAYVALLASMSHRHRLGEARQRTFRRGRGLSPRRIRGLSSSLPCRCTLSPPQNPHAAADFDGKAAGGYQVLDYPRVYLSPLPWRRWGLRCSHFSLSLKERAAFKGRQPPCCSWSSLPGIVLRNFRHINRSPEGLPFFFLKAPLGGHYAIPLMATRLP